VFKTVGFVSPFSILLSEMLMLLHTKVIQSQIHLEKMAERCLFFNLDRVCLPVFFSSRESVVWKWTKTETG
jgi:hypothetical protein